ncbi:hypothetical protein J0910_08270 [Nocardiopsis sp. CNT-189]
MNTIQRRRPPASRVRLYFLACEAERYRTKARHALDLARALYSPKGGAR